MQPRTPLKLALVASGLVVLAVIAWGAVAIAERYLSDNSDLRDLAISLVPTGAEIVLRRLERMLAHQVGGRLHFPRYVL